MTSTLRRLKEFDEQRPEIPGEHWMALAAGIGIWLATRHKRSTTVRLLGALAGGAMVVRAGSGRYGLGRDMFAGLGRR